MKGTNKELCKKLGVTEGQSNGFLGTLVKLGIATVTKRPGLTGKGKPTNVYEFPDSYLVAPTAPIPDSVVQADMAAQLTADLASFAQGSAGIMAAQLTADLASFAQGSAGICEAHSKAEACNANPMPVSPNSLSNAELHEAAMADDAATAHGNP